jgi:protease I
MRDATYYGEKGIICHGLWLISPVSEVITGRKVTAHNNLIGDVRNYGAVYVDQDVVTDNDLVTARTGGHCSLFAKEIISILKNSRN